MPQIRVRATVRCCVRGRWYEVGDEFDVDDAAFLPQTMQHADQPRPRTFADHFQDYHDDRGLDCSTPDDWDNTAAIAELAQDQRREKAPGPAGSKLEKGSKAAKKRMAELRAMRGKKQAKESKSILEDSDHDDDVRDESEE